MFCAKPNSNRRPSVSSILTCRIAVIICAIFWIIVPFIIVAPETIGHPSSAFVLFFYLLVAGKIGTVIALPAFWAALISGIGIAVCFFNLGKKTVLTRIAALATDISLAVILIVMLYRTDGGISNIMDVVGIGYIGIFAFLLLVYLLTYNKKDSSEIPRVDS